MRVFFYLDTYYQKQSLQALCALGLLAMPPAWIIKTFQVAIESIVASNIASIDIWDIFL